MVVKQLHLSKSGDRQRLSALVDDTEIWFELSSEIPLVPRVEAFLAPAMFEAMVRNAPVIVEDEIGVSARLLEALPTVQSIFRCWNPDLHNITIEANHSTPATLINGAVVCFSGGVDSSYTYICNHDAVSHLLVIQGFDEQESPSSWADNVAARARFADQQGKTLIAVSSNIREVVEQRDIYWGLVIGGILCGLGVTLAPRTFLVPSSWTYQDLHAYGSHPLIDPLWSTEATQVIHHGADARRSEKIERISQSQPLLDQLQVCWKSCSTNCGNCPKCVRTSVVLHLLEKQSQNLPAFASMHQLRMLKPDGEGSLPFVEDIILACESHGASAIQMRLRKLRRQFLLEDSAKNFAKVLFGRWAQQLYRKVKPREWHTTRATLRSRRSIF